MLKVRCSLPADLNAEFSIDVNLSFDTENELLLRAYVPGINTVSEIPSLADISIQHQESDKDVGLTCDDTNLLLRDSWNGKISQDLYHLLYSASRVKLLEQGFYSVHAACAGEDGQILIVGHSGSGKTTTALELVKHRDWKLASGNKTVVSFNDQNGILVQAGTSTMTIRNTDEAQYATPLGKNIAAYGGRIAFSLDESHFVNISEQPLKGIVIVRLHEGLRDAHEINPLSALHTLYPYFMDSVNADAIVAGGKGIFHGTPPTDSAENLSQKLSLAVSEIPVLSVAGPLSFVVETVASL